MATSIAAQIYTPLTDAAPVLHVRGHDRYGEPDEVAGSGRAEQDQIGAPVQPGIARCQRHDLGLADDRNGLEVEGIDGLARRQLGFGEMPFDAATAAFGYFVL